MRIGIFTFASVLVVKLLYSGSAEGQSLQPEIFLGKTNPENGSIIEIVTNGESETVLFCQFISEFETDIMASINWFFNSVEINFTDLQFFGVNFTVINNQRSLQNISSRIALIASDVDVPLSLNDGRITCQLSINDDSFELIGVFITFLAFRTVKISWGQQVQTVNENISSVTICADAEAWTTADRTLTIPILIQDDTATKDDFSGVPANITFAESSVCFQIQITDDDVVENDEYFSLDMGVPYSVSTQLIGIVDIVRSAAIMIIITDNDGATVGFSTVSQSVPESAGKVEVCVVVIGDSSICPVEFSFSVVISTISDTTVAIEDYTPIALIVSFLACQKRLCVDIPIVSNSNTEDLETFSVLLNSTEDFDRGISFGQRVVQTITIIDMSVVFESTEYTISENDQTIEVCLTRDKPLLEPITITLTTDSKGSATAGEDYVALSSFPVMLSSPLGHGCANVTIIPDNVVEDLESFTINVDVDNITVFLIGDSTTISIIDSTVCIHGDLRLVDGSNNANGRLEICFHHQWGSVCDDLFNEKAAEVACKQLGFENGGIVIDTGFPDGDQPTLMDDVVCTGNEIQLINCTHKTREETNCDRLENVGLICGEICNDGDVKILKQDGFSLVELCHDGVFLPVCHEEWDTFDATVVCRQSGYDKFSIPVMNSGIMTRGRTITNVTCLGTEDHAGNCPYIITDVMCQYAAVKCDSPSPCPGISFWCPESRDSDPLCMSRESVCNGLKDCPDTNADERVCAVVGFTEEGYTVKENDTSVEVCINVSFPDSPLFLLDPTITLSLSTSDFTDESGDISFGDYYQQLNTELSFNSINSTQCFDIEIIDNTVVSNSKRGFFLVLSPTQNMDLYIDTRQSIISTYVLILDDEACTVDEFYCESREECMSLQVICDGFSDCFSNVEHNHSSIDESDCEKVCPAETSEGLNWPATFSGSESVTITVLCPEDNNRYVIRVCTNGIWGEADNNTCLSFEDLLETNITEDNVVQFVGLLTSVVVGIPVEEQNATNVQIIADYLTHIALLIENGQLSTETTIEILMDILAILDSLLKWDQEALREKGPQNVMNFERILVSLIASENFNNSLSIVGGDISLLARPTKMDLSQLEETGLSFTITSQDEKLSITEGADDRGNELASVDLSSSVFTSEVVKLIDNQLAVAVNVYRVPTLFPLPRRQEMADGPETVVGTPVVSMIVAGDGMQLDIFDDDPLVQLTLEVSVENVTNPRCVFWNFTHQEWSTDGCKTQISDDRRSITCTCTHLTNFAALVDVCRRVEDCETSSEADYALGILSIFGVTLSLMGLALTTFTMLFFKTLRKRDASKFHIQLCIAMFAMLLVFLVGIQQTSVKAGCVTVSVLIHYFTLVTVMWMGAEAVLMFQKLVIVFVRITKRYIILISLICWLSPILLVIIPVALNPDYVIIESQDNNEGLCFISNTAVFFATFLAPILAIILFNCVVFSIIVGVLIRHKRRSKLAFKSSSKLKERGSNIRLMISIIGIMFIFGLTWLFGALTVDKASLSFQVLFVIFNSLQGFFIFLFFCVLGRDGRELWLEFLFCGRYKSTHLHPSSVSTGSYEKKANNLLLSSNTTSSTSAAQVVEKCIEVKSEMYAVNYVDFSEVSSQENEDGEHRDTTSIDEKPLQSQQDQQEENFETHANGIISNDGGRSLENRKVYLEQNEEIDEPMLVYERSLPMSQKEESNEPTVVYEHTISVQEEEDNDDDGRENSQPPLEVKPHFNHSSTIRDTADVDVDDT